MKTKRLKINELDKIVDDLNNGFVVGFPTETVYGLAIVYDNYKSFEALAKLKRRPITKPISMMIGENVDISNYAHVDDRAKKIIKAFMPGAITVVLNAKDNLPSHVTLNQNTVGIRIPTNKEALDILNKINKPLLVTSANLAGKESLMKASDVYDTFKGELASLIDVDAINGIASTVVDLSKDEIKILREGPISLNNILEVIK